MNISQLFRENAPTILAGATIASFAAAVLITNRVAPPAKDILDEMEEGSRIEKIKAVAPLYAPVLGLMLLGTGTLVMSNRIQNIRYASLFALYSIGERNLARYQQAVLDEVGAKKVDKIEARAYEPEIEAMPMGLMTGDETLFYDIFTGKPFTARSVETVRGAMNDINEVVQGEGWASLNEYYYRLGIDPCEFGDDIGWGPDKIMRLKFIPYLKGEQTIISVVFEVRPEPEHAY